MREVAAALVILAAATGCGDSDAPRGKKLEPYAKRSFVTPTRRTLVGVLGPGWALRVRLEEGAFPYHDADMPLERRVWASDAMLLFGPRLDQYVRPPSGVPTMPVPTGKGHDIFMVQDLWLTIRAEARRPEPDGYVTVALEPFTADGVRYVIRDTLELPLKGPYP